MLLTWWSRCGNDATFSALKSWGENTSEEDGVAIWLCGMERMRDLRQHHRRWDATFSQLGEERNCAQGQAPASFVGKSVWKDSVTGSFTGRRGERFHGPSVPDRTAKK